MSNQPAQPRENLPNTTDTPRGESGATTDDAITPAPKSPEQNEPVSELAKRNWFKGQRGAKLLNTDPVEVDSDEARRLVEREKKRCFW
jgi:hypothetical protein